MNLAFQAQKRLVTDQVPLPVVALHGEVKDLERLGAGATHRGLTDPESLAHLLPGAEPLKAIEGLQHILLNQARPAASGRLRSAPYGQGTKQKRSTARIASPLDCTKICRRSAAASGLVTATACERSQLNAPCSVSQRVRQR